MTGLFPKREVCYRSVNKRCAEVFRTWQAKGRRAKVGGSDDGDGGGGSGGKFFFFCHHPRRERRPATLIRRLRTN